MSYVAFPHLEGHWSEENTKLQRDLARIMVASVRRTMPGIKVLMITDDKTPAIEGIEPIRISTHGFADFIPWLCHCKSLLEGEVLYLDSDVVVQRDLRPLFNVIGDVVLPNRGPKIVDGRMQPFIFGVVAYRTAAFWAEVRDRVLAMEKVDRAWYGSQIATFEMWMEEQNGRGKWKIVSVPRDIYNYTPKEANEAPEDKWALHYKGKKRKAWMLERWKHLLEEKVAA